MKSEENKYILLIATEMPVNFLSALKQAVENCIAYLNL
jgi:hypothetical protein